MIVPRFVKKINPLRLSSRYNVCLMMPATASLLVRYFTLINIYVVDSNNWSIVNSAD